VRWRSATGYSLVEVVAAIAIFAVVAPALVGFLRWSMQQWIVGRQQNEALSSLRTAIERLGLDARIAGTGTGCTADGTQCVFALPGGPPVQYTFSAATGTLYRTAGAGVQIPVAAGLQAARLRLPQPCGQHCLFQASLQAGNQSVTLSVAMRNG